MSCEKRINKELTDEISSRYCLFKNNELGISRFSLIEDNFISNQSFKKRFILSNVKTGSSEINLYINYDYPFKSPHIELTPSLIDIFNLINLQNNRINGNIRGLTSQYSKWCSICIKNTGVNTLVIKRAWFFTLILYNEISKSWNIYPDKNECLCCQSITCGKNWTPAFTMYDVCNEFILRKTFFIFTCKLIQKRIISLFKNLFTNENWQLPEELILHILSFCHDNKTIDEKFLQEIAIIN